MNEITKREFQIMALYSKGLKFKEIAQCLNIAERTAINYFMRVKAKDKGRIKREKQSRAINKQSYTMQLKEVLHDVKEYNREVRRNKYTFRSEISIKNKSRETRLRYFDECLLFAYKSYHRFKLNRAKKVQQFREK
ncbi:LuxR C-terminal-related transcriptional regulator [Sulfurovum sp.]|uniref:LuxR C-terminal-related transcriptional regulator n=1 Tax=Sulfurovum sp. TaxID=1969726 RepID=UPI003567034F